MIYLTYAEIPSRKIDLEEIKGLFGEVSYLYSVAERKNYVSRQESFAALLLLAKTFKAVGVDASEITLVKDENGRPFVKGNTGTDFNLSHSERFVACAVSTEGRVGVDMEKVPDSERYEKIVGRFFSEVERETTKNARDFGRVWTRKEAYYKFIGKGSLAEADSENAKDVNIESYAVGEKYFISVCSKKSEDICQNPQKTEIG